MGSVVSKNKKSPEERFQLEKNKQIEKELKKEKNTEIEVIKLLLLGAAECGKSTVLKQIKVLHTNGFSAEEKEEKKATIYSNTLTCMVAILRAMSNLEICFADESMIESESTLVMEVFQKGQQQQPFTQEVSKALIRLWKDKGVQECYERNSEYRLLESAKYFLDSVQRISESNFEPTEQDIIKTRTVTRSVVQLEFELNKINFRVFDVGGQRSERRKWIHCFDNVNAIIFVAALSEYNQTLTEDPTQNRLEESLHLFGSICGSDWFSKTSIILFLNKKDLFAEKIPRIPLSVVFKEYKGGQNYDECAAYISQKFTKKIEELSRTIYSHETCATDKNQLEVVLNSVIDSVTKKNIHSVCAV